MTDDSGRDEAGPATILVVDDDALVAMGLAGVLEDLGYKVVEVHSGEQALAILDANPSIDLVITDQSMPGMTGTDLARAVGGRRPGLPVMLATGYRDVPEGADLSLPKIGKPYDDSAVAKAVEKILAGRTKHV